MKYLLTALVALLVGAAFPAVPGRAAPPPSAAAGAQARAALTMAAAARQRAANAFCGCTGPGDCVCPKGNCDCAACGNGARAKTAAAVPPAYAAAYRRAVAANEPLLVWAGRLTVPPYTNHWARSASWVQVAVPALEGCPDGCVTVARPDGSGGMVNAGSLCYEDHQILESEILLKLNASYPAARAPGGVMDPVVRDLRARAAYWQATRPAPALFAPPPMMWMGGFGGACRGGG